jgi:pimeloyl-ACP methyl ester carboxylesterase
MAQGRARIGGAAHAATHGTAEVAPGVRLHYVDAGSGPRTVVLLHGFPQTSHEWRRITPLLADAGSRVIAPDYRGAGASSKPASGYDKRTMASDIFALLHEHLGIATPFTLVGHDVGGIVAVAYAARYRDDVAQLAVIDTPLPGTKVFDAMRGDPRGWHAAFHSARDVAEMLVQGRERAYLQHMVAVRIFDPTAIAPEDFDVYVRAYEMPGGMRAAFELYRAFDEDGKALRAALAEDGKLAMPVLAVAGVASGLAKGMGDALREIADDVDVAVVPRAAHWVPEENPAFLADALVAVLARRAAETVERRTKTRRRDVPRRQDADSEGRA